MNADMDTISTILSENPHASDDEAIRSDDGLTFRDLKDVAHGNVQRHATPENRIAAMERIHQILADSPRADDADPVGADDGLTFGQLRAVRAPA